MVDSPASATDRAGAPVRAWPPLALAVFVVLCIAVCLVGIEAGWLRVETLQEWVEQTGMLAWASYLLGNVLLCVLWVPRMWRLMAGGLLFGPVVGGALSVVADMIGGVICYLFARSAGRALVERWLGARPRAERLVHLLAVRRGTGTMALVRVCPLFHYTLGSYAAGLAGVRWPPYLVGSFLGVVPGAILYPLAGDAMLRPTSPAFIGSIAAIVLFLLLTLWAARRGLEQGDGGPPD